MYRKYLYKSLFLLVILTFLASCAGYQKNPEVTQKSPGPTFLIFLVDGFSANLMQMAVSQGKAREIHQFFFPKESKFPIGRASFPTLTYPNIASILTAEPVGTHPIISNHVAVNGKVVNFESPSNHEALRQIIDPNTVIGRLEKRQIPTASFSYIFGQNADSHTVFGAKEGLEYQRHDYQELDERLLTNLEELLQSPDPLPKFIYIHLVGVDGREHQFGPKSKLVLDYVQWLDQRLAPVFAELKKREKRQKIVSILTADHGFASTPNFFPIEKPLKKDFKKSLVINESRFIALQFPIGTTADYSKLAKYKELPEVDSIVSRKENRLTILTKEKSQEFEYLPANCGVYSFALKPLSAPASFERVAQKDKAICPQDFDTGSPDGTLPPFYLSNLSNFLNSPNHPDAVLLAAKEITYSKGALGNHGGTTLDEITVPVLVRNAKMISSSLLPTYEILKSLR